MGFFILDLHDFCTWGCHEPQSPGWLVGSVLLHPLMQRLTIKQLLVFLASIMLLLSLASITLPYIPHVSLTMLFGVRLLHGICLNIQGV